MRNGLPFDLTLEWVKEAVTAFCSSHHHSFDRHGPFKPSLDRTEGKLGYIQTNVRVLWMIENLARNNFSDAQVLEFCKRKLGIPINGGLEHQG